MDKFQKRLLKKLDDVNAKLQYRDIRDYIEFSGFSAKRFWCNFLNGIARGVGSAIGVSFVFTLLVIILKWIAGINIPIISDFVFWIIGFIES
jgi:hypothetical protein